MTLVNFSCSNAELVSENSYFKVKQSPLKTFDFFSKYTARGENYFQKNRNSRLEGFCKKGILR